MPDNLKLQSEVVTQERFDRLPALLSAYEVKLVTGFNDAELAARVRAGEIAAVRNALRKGRRKAYCKYTKLSVARLTGFKC